MRPTLKDIAQESGFSITTVSRALAGYEDVSEDTRRQILDIAEKIQYQPNQIARQLQGKRTNTIGLVVPAPQHDSADDVFSLMLKGITYAAARREYDVLVSAPLHHELDVYRRLVGGHRVDGMIIARLTVDDPRIYYLQKMKHPFIAFGRRSPEHESNFPHIDVDGYAGIKTLCDHFIELGHRHIALILPPENVTFTAYRLHGYQDSLREADLPYREVYVIYGDLTAAGGADAAHHLLTHFTEITAIIGCNDWMALGAMTAIEQRQLRVGADVAVGGYDDIPAAAHASPPLTTLRQPIYELGEMLTESLISIIHDEDPTMRLSSLIQPELVIRASSGGVRN